MEKLQPRDGWYKDAACRGLKPSLWDTPENARQGSNREAQAICAGCPVKQDCLYDFMQLEGHDAAAVRACGVIRAGMTPFSLFKFLKANREKFDFIRPNVNEALGITFGGNTRDKKERERLAYHDRKERLARERAQDEEQESDDDFWNREPTWA